MEKEQLIKQAKQFRKDADELLQRMKDHEEIFFKELPTNPCCCDNAHEAIAQHIISIRDLESAIMRQGMVLKAIGTPNPYPESYNPENTVVEPTADGLKL